MVFRAINIDSFSEKYKTVLILVISSLLFSSILHGQSFNTIRFSNQDGLNSNLVKKAIQDEDGFMWFASDDGLVKYNGISVENFTTDLPSSYVKYVAKGKFNKIYVATDFGVGYMKKEANSYRYIPLVSGGTIKADTSVHYPKFLYEDKNQVLWIGGAHNVSKLVRGEFIKYEMDKVYWSDDYSKSYSFAEDKNDMLIIASWQGFLFYYDRAEDKLINIKYENEGQFHISSLKNYKGKIYATTDRGFCSVNFSPDYKNARLNLIVPLEYNSTFQFDKEGNLFLGTARSGLRFYNFANKDLKMIDSHNFMSLKSLEMDNDGGIWICSNSGITLLTKNRIGTVNLTNIFDDINSPYITHLREDNNGKIYFISLYRLFQLDEDGNRKSPKEVLIQNNWGLYDFRKAGDNSWLSFRDGELVLIDRFKNVLFRKMFGEKRLGNLTIDHDNNLWGFLEGSNSIIRISEEFKIKKYDVEALNYLFVESIKVDENGDLYIAGSGADNNYVQKYNTESDTFIPIINNNIPPQMSGLQVFDIAVNKGVIYLASKIGAVKIENGIPERINISIGKNHITLRSVVKDDMGGLWFGSDQGIFHLLGDKSTKFLGHSGLPSMSISKRGLMIDRQNRLWIATAEGLGFYEIRKEKISQTRSPILIDIIAHEDYRVDSKSDTEFYSGADIQFNFVSTNYPTKRISYQAKLLGKDSTWKNLGETNYYLTSNLKPGKYILKLKAEKSGNYGSDVTNYEFTVIPMWYFSTIMIVLYIIIFIMLSWFAAYLYERVKLKRLKERENLLSILVEEKTQQLLEAKLEAEKLLEQSEEAKKRLENANEIKSKLLSVAAHDLKNPLQAILGYEFVLEDSDITKDELNDILVSIFKSSRKMTLLIDNILNSAAKDITDLELNPKNVNISYLLEDTVAENEIRAKQKDQEILSRVKPGLNARVDSFWFKEALDNLISNAVKYSPYSKKIFINAFPLNSHIVISVIDEGPGISEEDQKDLFKRFTRLSAIPTGGESSTGLGLSVVKEIISAHKAEVKCESTFGEGSKFSIILPPEICNL